MAETQRRLTTIVAVDIAGFARLVSNDEEGALTAQRNHRAELIEPLPEEHQGRIANTAGDRFLLEFPSAVEAMRFCTEVQQGMAARNRSVPQEQRIEYRIGVNVGDVMADGDDLLGDSVNIAARIEALAAPGGINLSHTVHDQIRDRMTLDFEDMGKVEVKNIARPVRVFRVLSAEEVPGEARRPRAPWLKSAVAARIVLVIVLVIMVGGGAWWWTQQPDFTPADPEKFAYKLPDKPSIAVLPFENFTGDPKQDYLGDGMTENIIAVLSTSPDLFVIARNSSFIFKGKATKVQDVAEKLGVRYVLESSVQRSGDKLRVVAQLVDAIDSKHLWARHYDRELQDLFALYDGISKDIALGMHVNLTIGEWGKSWVKAVGATETFRLGVLGRSRLNSSTAAGLKEAEDLFLESHKREPDNALANLMLASVHIQKLMTGLSTDPLSDLAKAQSFVDKAQSVMESGIGFSLVATLKLFATDHSAALAQAEHAIELDPSGSETIALAGTVKTLCGKVPHGIVLLRRAMRLQPYHPIWMPAMLGFARLQLGENEAAERIFESIMSTANVDGFFYRLALSNISAIAVFEGDMDKAREYLARVLKKNPTGNAYHVAQQLYFLKDQEFVQRYVAALRKAGLPEY